ncbi:MAG: hypothetical protein INH37_17390, partial [Myxococcaceae bacterium]|nr:hypothetical protein [Myxococcaceae bacterium]
PMPGLSWTIRRYLVKGDRAAAVARAIRQFDGTEKAPAAPRRRARAALKKRRKRAG